MEIIIKGKPVRIDSQTGYICISDIAKAGEGEPSDILKNYIKNNDTVKFLIEWEKAYNPDFKPGRMAQFRLNILDNNKSYRIGRYIQETGAIGIFSKAGRYGGTYAHEYIAIHFCTWFNPVIFLYFIKEFVEIKQLVGENWLKGVSFFVNKLEKETHSSQILA